MNNIQRGEALLSKLGPSLGLTPCGKDWLIAALDPFHDNQLDNLTGYPDAITSCSVIRQVKQSLELATAASEDIYVVAWPWLGNTELGAYSQTASTVVLPGAAVGQVAGVSVYKPVAANPPDYAAVPAQGLAYPNTMMDGKGRLVGMGIELINTTAPINRSGTVYCWRLPGTQDNEETLQYLTAGALTRVGHVRRLATPPRSPAQAMLIPGTRSWASEEGAYLVCPFEEDNPPIYPTTNYPIMNTIPSAPMNVGSTNGPTNVITGNCASTSLSCRLTPCNLFGVIATGNNPNSKFTLNVVWYYEEFPDEQSDILTLATPSCDLDPVALKLYTHVLNTLPVAVPSSWNTAGDWWWDVVSAVKDYASQVGGMIGGAPGAAIGAAAGTVAGWARDRYMTAPGSNGSGVPQKKKTQPNVQQQRAKQKQAAAQYQTPKKAKPQGGKPSQPKKKGRNVKKSEAQAAIDALWSAR